VCGGGGGGGGSKTVGARDAVASERVPHKLRRLRQRQQGHVCVPIVLRSSTMVRQGGRYSDPTSE
jgi:hypothetical protein